jgi:hypothetical protein
VPGARWGVRPPAATGLAEPSEGGGFGGSSTGAYVGWHRKAATQQTGNPLAPVQTRIRATGDSAPPAESPVAPLLPPIPCSVIVETRRPDDGPVLRAPIVQTNSDGSGEANVVAQTRTNGRPAWRCYRPDANRLKGGVLVPSHVKSVRGIYRRRCCSSLAWRLGDGANDVSVCRGALSQAAIADRD